MAISIFNKTSIFILSLSFMLVLNSYGQNVSKYELFTTPAVSYAAIAGTSVSITNKDEDFANGLPIGFDFWYLGVKHTKFSVSTNGFMALSQTLTSAMPTNDLKLSATRNVIAPLWDDLAIFGTGTNPGIRYLTEGAEGSRILTVQWREMEWNKTSTSRISFQAKLYEGTGEIRFIYINGTGSGSPTSPSASIGISGPTSGQFASVTPATTAPVANAAINYTSEKSNIATKPANNVNYLFKSTAVAAPTNLTFTAIGPNHLTLNWTNVATDNIGYVIYRSTNATTGFSQSGAMVGANATSYADTGLDQMTTYYYKVYAVRETLSATSTVNATTIISCLETVTGGAVANYKLNGDANDAMGLNAGALQNNPTASADRFQVANKAYTFNGTNQFLATATIYKTDVTVFTTSCWFKTTTNAGGVLIAFGASQTSTTNTTYTHGNQLYMTTDGSIYFGVYKPADNSVKTVNSAAGFNDGRWHQVTAVLSASGMRLYLDGVKVGTDNPNTVTQYFDGYWRVGHMRMNNTWPGWNAGDRVQAFFAGTIDDVLIYHKGLSDAEAKALYPAALIANSTGPVCAGYPFNLTAATTFAGATYQWTRPDGTTFSGQNQTGLMLNNASVGVYKVSVTSATGCVTTSATRVNFTDSPGQWAGKISTAWANPDNWCAGTLPTVATNVTIPTTGPTFNPTLTTVGLSDSITVESNRALTISGSGDLQVAGTITKATTGTITASAGKVTLNGTAAQEIPANVFASNFVKDLTLNNTAGVTLNGTLRLTGLLTPSAGIFQTGGNLTLASSETATASVATIPLNTSVRGSVKVERFLKGGAMNPYRTYRMLSSPVYDNTTDFVNTNVEGNRSAKFSQLIDDMIISGANGAAGGFDVTHNNQVSAWTYSGGFTPITNINAAVNAGKGMYVFFRGNRNNFQAKTNAPYTNPEDVVMNFDGVLNQQDVTVTLPNGGSFLGNPYAATINWDSGDLVKTNLNNAIWIWNPQKRSYATYKNGVGLLGGSRYIASGQSFFAQTNVAGAGSITFKESSKATSQQAPALLMAAAENNRLGFSEGMTLQNFDNPRSTLRVSMKPLASYGEDETVVVFNEGSSAAFDDEDATHIDGEVVNITTLAGTKKLAINFHAPVTPVLDIPVHINAAATGSYTLQFNNDEYVADQELVLKDNSLNIEIPITANLVYSFNIDKANTQTFGANRFKIAAAASGVLPITLAYFTANKQNNGVSLAWKTLAETDFKYFEVHRAGADGLYVKLGQVDSKGVGVYGFVDSQPKSGVNYYRLSPLNVDGNVLERKIIAVEFDANALNGVVLYPNPVIENFTIKLSTLQIGLYSIEIYDVTGKKIKSSNASNVQLLKGYQIAANQLPAGVYFVEVRMIKGGEIIAVDKFIKR